MSCAVSPAIENALVVVVSLRNFQSVNLAMEANFVLYMIIGAGQRRTVLQPNKRLMDGECGCFSGGEENTQRMSGRTK